MLSDRFSLYASGFIVLAFVVCCIIDVAGFYPLMSNLAILLILALGFLVIVTNAIVSLNKKEDAIEIENLPEPEEEPTEYRQIY